MITYKIQGAVLYAVNDKISIVVPEKVIYERTKNVINQIVPETDQAKAVALLDGWKLDDLWKTYGISTYDRLQGEYGGFTVSPNKKVRETFPMLKGRNLFKAFYFGTGEGTWTDPEAKLVIYLKEGTGYYLSVAYGSGSRSFWANYWDYYTALLKSKLEIGFDYFTFAISTSKGKRSWMESTIAKKEWFGDGGDWVSKSRIDLKKIG